MQQLHLVGFTTDLEGLIFSARKGAKSGGYLVMLDDRLRATIEDALRLREGDDALDDGSADGTSPRPRRPRPQSTLSPREIQARLRTGSSIEEVAAEAGVDEEWVGRFAAPILAEQAQVVARARSLTFAKPRLGESALPLGDAVRWNLADRDVRFLDDDFDAAWSAYSLQGASWVVRFQFTSRGKRQTGEWEVDLREGELFARNRIASELAYVDASRRRRRPPVLEPSPRETPAPGGAGAGPRRDGASATPTAAAPAKAVRGVAAAPRLPLTAAAARGGSDGASARKAAGTRAAAKKAAVKKLAAVTGTGKAGSARATAKGASAKRAGSAASNAAASKKPASRGVASKSGASKGAASKAAAAKRAATKKALPARVAAGRTGSTVTAASRRASTAAGAGARKASTASSARKAAKAVAPPRRTAGAGRGRTTKSTGSAAKKPAPEHRVPAPSRTDASSSAQPDIAVRRSHLARPASPMPMANRAPVPGAASTRPAPRTLAPTAGDRVRRDEGFRVLDRPGGDGEMRLPPPRRPAPPPAPVREAEERQAPQPSPREQLAQPREAAQEPRRERPAAPAASEPAQERRPVAAEAGEAAEDGGAARSTADQRLARRLAARQNGAEGGRRRTPPPPPDLGDEPVWHGPGSGEPAPAVRIRADVAAAANVRSTEPAQAPDSAARPARRRRERPLRPR